MEFLWVGLGSGLGGMARHGVTLLSNSWWGTHFPWGTLLVNCAGSFLIGLLTALAAGALPPGLPLQRFLLPGFLGGFTTFSAFSHQTISLWRQGDWTLAAFNVLGSLAACLAAAWLGFRWGRTIPA